MSISENELINKKSKYIKKVKIPLTPEEQQEKDLLKKQKLAELARNYYHKRCTKDPEYKQLLCERVKKNNKIRNPDVKPVGRPCIYQIKT
jgi:hypothetical protein